MTLRLSAPDGRPMVAVNLRCAEDFDLSRLTVTQFDGASLPPVVTWGSSPEDVVSVTGIVPNPDLIEDETRRSSKRSNWK